MKKTWKCWLGTVAAAMLGGTAMAQAPDMDFGSEGAVRLGAPSGSATTSYAPGSINTYEPLDADAVWAEAPRAYQGAPPPGDESVGFASSASYNDTQWRVGRVNSNLYGFNGGYTSIGAFIPLSSDGQNMWFFDPRAIITDYGQGAANLGLGYRRYSYAMDRIFGASIWYDYDNGHRTDYSQIGLSLENIGRYFSTRFNANVPLSDSNDFTTAASFGTPFFQGNNIAYLYSFLREMPYQNYVAEAAAPVPFFGRYGWEWAISAYGLVANDSGARDAIGIGGRFEWQVSEDFFINTTITHDRIFSTNASVNFELTIPSGPQVRWLRPKRVHDKLLASVKRPYRVSTSTSGFSETRLFLDPSDGTPIQVAHINPNLGTSSTSGSVTNPFNSLANYMADANRSQFDIIFVDGRDDLSDTNLNTTIELLDGQRLLGTGALADGTVHQFQALAVNGQTVFNLPGFGNGTSNTGPNPFLTNSDPTSPVGSPVVRINGNYTEVTGFTIDATDSGGVRRDGIASVGNDAVTPRTVDSFVITNNTIQNAVNAINILSDTTPAATGPTTMPPARSLGLNDNVGNISNNTIDGTVGAGVTNGIVVDHQGGADPLELRVANNDVTGATGVGIDILASGGTIDGTATNFGFVGNTVADSGVGIRATANNATFNTNVESNTVTGSLDAADPLDPTVGAGMIFLAEAGGSMTLDTLINNDASGNAGRGAAFVADGAGSTLVITPATSNQNNTFNNNGDDGALFAATNSGALTATTLAGNTATGNAGDGFDILAQTGGTATVGMFANTISGNTLNGINALADGGTITTQIGTNTLGIPQTVVTGNTLNGINLEVTALGGTLNGVIENVAVTNNLTNGIRIAAAGGTNNVSIDGTTTDNNLITGNGVDGIAVIGTGAGAINVASLTNNTITGNTQDGIDVNLAGTSTATFADVSGNTVTNGAFGMRVTQIDSTVFNLNMGASGATNGLNVFDGNVDAGVGMSLRNAAIANIQVTNSTFSNTTNSGADTTFNGEGFHVRLIDTAQLVNATFGDAVNQNTTFLNNAGSGIALFADGDAQITNPLVQNTTFTNNGTVEGDFVNGGLVPNDGDAGFRLIRQGNGVVNNVVLNNNTFTGNANGILAIARNGNLNDEYTITNNTITGNDSRGIALRAEFDADITALIESNTISNNGNEGIQTTERRNSGGDSLTVNLEVYDNLIENNGQNGVVTRGQGIEISAVHASVIIGDNANPTPDNTIRGNSGDGIEINNSGVAVIQNNLIQGNGGDAGIDLNAGGNQLTIDNNLITGNTGDGIELSALGYLTSQMLVTVTDNVIRLNGQDGIEVLSATAATSQVNITTGNIIEDNSGRGVAVFNRGAGADNTTRLTVNLNDNTIQRNGEEGVYVVNTSSTTQSTDAASTVAMDASGSVFADPRLIFNMSGNNVRDNGVLSGFSGTGLVIRVGTSDASRSFTDDGGFANARGGIIASVIGNSFGGNAGSDVYFESFVSTVNPNQTNGQWTDNNDNPRNNANDIFVINGEYQSDPLARMDLTFNNNTGEELDATNTGAFYNNDESVFKSRTRGQDGNDPNGPFPGTPDDDGPFGSGTRQRNAQRLAGRFQLPPTIGAGSTFLFSGVGESTFRVSAVGNAFGTVSSPFFTDADPYLNPLTDANGVGPYGGGPLGIDSMPWGWSTLP